jgi:hypothetical protein
MTQSPRRPLVVYDWQPTDTKLAEVGARLTKSQQQGEAAQAALLELNPRLATAAQELALCATAWKMTEPVNADRDAMVGKLTAAQAAAKQMAASLRRVKAELLWARIQAGVHLAWAKVWCWWRKTWPLKPGPR